MSDNEHKPDVVLLSKEQLEQYKDLVGFPEKGSIVAKGHHTWVADGKGGVVIDDSDSALNNL